MDQHQSEAKEAIKGSKSWLIGARDDREDTDDATRNKEILGIIMNHNHFNLYEPISIYLPYYIHINSIRMGLRIFFL